VRFFGKAQKPKKKGCKMVISEHDDRLVSAFIKAEVFQKIRSEQICGNHTIAVICGDCNHSEDIIKHHLKVCGHAPQLLGLNGGALLIPTNSPLRGARTRGNILIEDIVESVELKSINRVVLYAHTVCGKAHGIKLRFRDSIDLHVKAKERLKRSRVIQSRLESKKLSLYCFHHIYFPNGERKTFFINRPNWTQFHRETEFLPDEEIFKRYDV
jgi:hypothetical protein